MLRESQETLTLIQEVLDKNRVAEENFYNKYKKIVEDYIRYKLPKIHSKEDFEDCVSIILTKIFLSLDRYDPEKSSFKSWVITITRHFMCDWSKSSTVSFSGAQIPIAFSSSFDGTFTVNGTPCNYSITNNSGNTGDFVDGGNATYTTNDTTFIGNCTYFTSPNIVDFENCNSLIHISNQISPADFTLLNMKYIQGYDYCEIGKEFNISSNTASNRVNYLKTKLKKNNVDMIY
jgi:RNA polymerase sigma factor (sigma-70 family)